MHSSGRAVFRDAAAFAALLACASLTGCGGSEQASRRTASPSASQTCTAISRETPGKVVKAETSTAGQVREAFRAKFGRDERVLAAQAADAPVALCTFRLEPGAGSPPVGEAVMAVTASGDSTWVDGQLVESTD